MWQETQRQNHPRTGVLDVSLENGLSLFTQSCQSTSFIIAKSKDFRWRMKKAYVRHINLCILAEPSNPINNGIGVDVSLT